MKLPEICGGFINLTQKCNLNCKYCFVVQQPKQMTLETAIDAVDFYARSAIAEGQEPSVTFFGGEPMLKYKEIIVPTVKHIRATYGDYYISITTNGTLLNEEVYEFFKANNVDMLLSLDGNQETQDFNRPYHSGKGSFDDIDVDMHLKYYPNGTFRATIDNDTVEKVYENYLWGEEKGFTNCSFILNIFADWTEKEIEILKAEIDKITAHIKKAREDNKPFMAFNEIENYRSESKLLKNISDDYFRDAGQGCAACGRCGLGGTRYGSIGASGDIYSCQEMVENPEAEHFKIGNIYDGIDNEARLKIANSFNTRDVVCEDEDRCKDCKLYKICNGACTINNYFKFGKLEVMAKVQCELYEHYLEKYEEIYGGGN